MRHFYSPPLLNTSPSVGEILVWSSGHWGLWWAKSQICQLLDQGLSALRIGTLDIFTDFMFWDPPGTNSASLESGQPQQRSLLSSFFCCSAEGAAEECRSLTPPARLQRQLFLQRCRRWREQGYTCAQGAAGSDSLSSVLQHSSPQGSWSSFILRSVTVPIWVLGHHPSHSGDIMGIYIIYI